MSTEIYAVCYTDDGERRVKFNAVGWFKKASVVEIVRLMDCGFGGDYPADEVALNSRAKGLTEMFRYVEEMKVGFECQVSRNDALAWLRGNREDVLKELPMYLGEAGGAMRSMIHELLS